MVHADSGDSILLHLGMTGRLWVTTAAGRRRAHEHVVFALRRRARAAFADPRRFGMVEVVPTAKLRRHPLLRGLGPSRSATGSTPTPSRRSSFFATRRRRKPVKNFLMDTRTIAGVGNIYACEALPTAPVSIRAAPSAGSPARAGRA